MPAETTPNQDQPANQPAENQTTDNKPVETTTGDGSPVESKSGKIWGLERKDFYDVIFKALGLLAIVYTILNYNQTLKVADETKQKEIRNDSTARSNQIKENKVKAKADSIASEKYRIEQQANQKNAHRLDAELLIRQKELTARQLEVLNAQLANEKSLKVERDIAKKRIEADFSLNGSKNQFELSRENSKAQSDLYYNVLVSFIRLSSAASDKDEYKKNSKDLMTNLYPNMLLRSDTVVFITFNKLRASLDALHVLNLTLPVLEEAYKDWLSLSGNFNTFNSNKVLTLSDSSLIHDIKNDSKASLSTNLSLFSLINNIKELEGSFSSNPLFFKNYTEQSGYLVPNFSFSSRIHAIYNYYSPTGDILKLRIRNIDKVINYYTILIPNSPSYKGKDVHDEYNTNLVRNYNNIIEAGRVQFSDENKNIVDNLNVNLKNDLGKRKNELEKEVNVNKETLWKQMKNTNEIFNSIYKK